MFQLGGRTYFTKNEIRLRSQEILRRHFQSRKHLLGEDHLFIADLLLKHPKASEKIGCGVRHFTVERNPLYGTASLIITRHDDSRIDFSYRECIAPSKPRADILAALRNEVRGQVVAFRDLVLPGAQCPVANIELTPENIEIHHVPPNTFDALADRFIFDEGGEAKLQTEEIEAICGIGTGCMRLCDRARAERWKAFHARQAVLCALSEKGHKIVTKAQRRRG